MTRKKNAEQRVREMINHVDNEMQYLHPVDKTIIKETLNRVSYSIPCGNIMLLNHLITLLRDQLFAIDLEYEKGGQLSIWPLFDELSALYPDWGCKP